MQAQILQPAQSQIPAEQVPVHDVEEKCD
jgi:hypothetical protein